MEKTFHSNRVHGEILMSRKRKRKTPRRRKQHFATGSAMNIDRRQEPERRAGEINGSVYRDER